MKQIIQFILCISVTGSCVAQQISGVEYFFDVDPGTGNGIPLAISPNDSIDVSFDIPYSDLSEGFHSIYFRFHGDSGLWSMNESRAFLVQTMPFIDATIVTAEYFFDVDPGTGNASPLSINSPSDSVEQNFAIPFENLTTGFHFFFLRVKNQSGLWSTVDQRGIYVMPAPITGTNIISGEYFVDTEPGVGNGTFFSVPDPGDDIESDIPLLLPELELGPHKLYIRLRNAEGNWTLIEPRPFTVCETYGAVASFEIQENGNMIVLENQSLFADSISWNMGDGSFSQLNDPVYFYDESGVYNVSLIALNDCGIDTMTVVVTVEGVEAVVPGIVSNSAMATLTTSGFGFIDGTTFKLTRDGFDDIIPFNNTVSDSYHLSSVVNFIGQSTGLWNVVVDIPGEGVFELQDAVEVVDGAISNSNILMTSATPGAARTGRRVPATMHIQNNNQGDILATPMFFRDIADVQQLLYTDLAPLTEVAFFQETYQYLLDNGISNVAMEFSVSNEDLNSRMSGFIMPKIAASSSYDLPFFVKRTIDGTHQRGSGMIYPQLTSESQLGVPEYQNEVCFGSFIETAFEKTLSIDMDDSEWQQCYGAWNDSLYKTIANLSSNPEMSFKPISYGACITSLFTHMAAEGCISNLPSVLTSDQLQAVIGHVMANILYLNDAQDVALDCPQMQGMIIEAHDELNNIEDEDRENEFCDLVMECGGMTISGGAAQGWCLLFGGSVDPNVKYGPGNNLDDIFSNPGDIAAYTISFENDSAASAPAEIVYISDTLQQGKFDLHSFEWGPVMLSDSIFIQPESHNPHQVILHDLRPSLPYYLLASLDFDTTTAIVEWKFETLDTLNLQPLDLMLDGFLPPNVDGTEGIGDVTFYIHFSPELQTGDSILNNATIVFDYNAPIITPYWLNVVDFTAPVSEVNELQEEIENTSFEVTWSGEDAPAGISSYIIYVSENDGPFLPWIIASNETSATYEGEIGSFYKFYSVATDIAGNMEDAPDDPWNNYDATTLLVTSIAEINSDVSVALFPNPASDMISLRLTMDQKADVRVRIYDLPGDEIEMIGPLQSATAISPGNNIMSYDISALAQGVYFLRVFVNEQSTTMRFVKK